VARREADALDFLKPALLLVTFASLFIFVGFWEYDDTWAAIIRLDKVVSYNVYMFWTIIAGLWLTLILVAEIARRWARLQLRGGTRLGFGLFLGLPVILLLFLPSLTRDYWQGPLTAAGYVPCSQGRGSHRALFARENWHLRTCGDTTEE